MEATMVSVGVSTTSGSCKDDLALANIEIPENTLGDDDIQVYPTGQKVLRDAILDMLGTFEAITMDAVNTENNMDTYFWLNYVVHDDDNDQGVAPGHVKGAYQYTPGAGNDINRALKMWPMRYVNMSSPPGLVWAVSLVAAFMNNMFRC